MSQEPFRIACACGFSGEVPGHFEGKAVRCKQCGEMIRAERPAPPLEIKCACGFSGVVPAHFEGKVVRCKGCNATLTVTRPPAPVTIRCSCGFSGEVPPQFAGKVVRCKGCKATLQVPAAGRPLLVPGRFPLPRGYRVVCAGGHLEVYAALIRVRDLFSSWKTIKLQHLRREHVALEDYHLVLHADRVPRSEVSGALRINCWSDDAFVPVYRAVSTALFRAGEPLLQTDVEAFLRDLLGEADAGNCDGLSAGKVIASVLSDPARGLAVSLQSAANQQQFLAVLKCLMRDVGAELEV